MMYDIDHNIQTANLLSFADDTRLWSKISLKSFERDAADFQTDLDSIYAWAERNGAPFNIGKFDKRSIGKDGPSLTLRDPNGKPIAAKESTRDLGITLTDSLNFHQHIANIVTEGNQLAGWAKRVFQESHKEVILTILKSLVIPKL